MGGTLGRLPQIYALLVVVLGAGSWFLASISAKRKQAEEELRQHRDQLRELVAERTKELESANEQLRGEIVEHKSTGEVLQESEERYRNLVENTLDMIQSVALDGHFIFVNRAWLETLGYTEVELPDLNLFNIIHPESLAHCQELFAKVMRGESIQNVQVTFIAKDGREIQAEGNATPRYVGSNIIATQGVFHDITERKQAEEALQKSEEHFRSVVETANDAIVSINSRGQIIFWNKRAETIFGYSIDEIINKPLTILIPEKFRQRYDREMKQLISTGESDFPGRLFETVGLRKDGSEFCFLLVE